MRRSADYARITEWAIMELTTPDDPAYRHIIGYIVSHDRLSGDDENKDSPYVSSPIKRFDVTGPSPVAINQRGKRIELLTPLREGELPRELLRQMQHAEQAWNLPDGSKWERLSLEAARALAEPAPDAAAELPAADPTSTPG